MMTTMMKMHSGSRLLAALTLMVVFAGCDSSPETGQPDSASSGKPVVAAANYPLKFFAERIGADDIDVVYLVDADIDPAFWKPSTEAISKLQKADVVLLNGAGFESWLTGVTLSASKLADTTKKISDQLIEVEDAVVHQHGPEGDHSHAGYAFTTWLDPQIAIVQASVVRDELAKLLPDEKTALDNRFAELEKNLREIDSQLNQLSGQIGQQHIIASHPVYQYLAKRMNLNLDSVHFELDGELTDGQWTEFDELVDANQTKLMLWEGEPLDSVRKQLEDRGISVVVFEPMGNQPSSGDYQSGMLANIERLKSATQ